MTENEARDICKNLTKINVAIWNATSVDAKSDLRKKFISNVKTLQDAGFNVSKWHDKDGIPLYRARLPRHKDDVIICSNCPSDVHIKGDCTTRCISFCTGIDYMKIRNEQISKASITNGEYSWRCRKIWEQSLLTRGFARISINGRHLSRSTFIRHAQHCPVRSGIIATVSSNHVAAIDMSKLKILDTWNSGGGRILHLYVPTADANAYECWLKNLGFNASLARP